jgi:hypothetical protein
LSHINSFSQQNHCPFGVETTWIKWGNLLIETR